MMTSLDDRADSGSGRANQLVRTVCLSSVMLTFCLAAFVVSSTSHAVADDPPKSQTERLRSTVLRLPELLKSRRKSATGTTAEKATGTRNRFVSRTIQLLAEARRLEKNGEAEAALEMAQRAESVLNTAQQTAGVSWPTGEESPQQYITAMKLRTGATGTNDRSVATARRPESVPGKRLPHPKPASPASLPIKSGKVPSESASVDADDTADGKQKLLLDWGSTRLPFTGIALTAGTKQEREETDEIPDTDDADIASDADEAGLLLKQLSKLELWTSVDAEEVDAEETAPETATGSGRLKSNSKSASSLKTSMPRSGESDQADGESLPPLVIPGLIDRPDGIDDQNVGPIPTHPTESVSGSPSKAITTTIPIVPTPDDSPPSLGSRTRSSSNPVAETEESNTNNESSVYSSSPQLLTNTDHAVEQNETTVWQLAAAQLLSTFLGVVFAVAAFLTIRAIASRLFGTHLGVTFQFGASTKPATNTDADDQADVVPFGNQFEQPDSQPKRAGGVANPEDFPFRIVGSATGEDELVSEQQAERERDGAILKTVFEHNVKLLHEMDHNNESAA